MNDESLRDLERAVATDGGATTRLKYARALERSGRNDEALDVLLPARESEEVRREIGRFPAARTDRSEGEGVAVGDVAPLEPAPRLAWTRELDEEIGRESFERLGAFLTSPLAVVFHARGSPVRVLELESGDDIWEHVWDEDEDSGLKSRVFLAGDELVLASDEHVLGRDLWDGTRRWRLEPEDARLNGVSCDQRRLALWTGGELSVYRRADAEPQRSWTATIRGGFVSAVTFVARLALVQTGDRLLALDDETGEQRWEIRGRRFLIDEHGLLVRRSPRDYSLFDLENNRVRSAREPGLVTLLPDALIHQFDRDEPNVVVDRASGQRREWRGETSTLAPLGVARDVVYATHQNAAIPVFAARLDGSTLWDELEVTTPLSYVSPVHRGLVLLTSDGTISKLTAS